MRGLGTILGLQIERYFMQGPAAASWPRRKTDILGSNARDSVIQCCRWLDEYPSFQLVHLIASFAEDERDISTLLHSATLPRNIVYLLNHACDVAPPNFGQLGMGSQYAYKLPIVLITGFIRRVSSITDGVSSAYFYEEQAEPMLDALTRVGRELQDPSIGMDIMWSMVVGSHGGAIHEKLALPYDPVRYHPDIIDGSLANRASMCRIRNETPFATAQNLLYVLELIACSNPDCTAGETGVSWQRCSGCRRVKYCSQSCQVHEVSSFTFLWSYASLSLTRPNEWKHERKPHKAVCAKLNSLGQVAGFPGAVGGRALPPKISDAAFESRCIQERLDRASVHKVNLLLMQDNRIMKILHRGEYR
jgi:hypothetical protein